MTVAASVAGAVAGALTGFSIFFVAVTIFVTVRRILPGEGRDQHDNDRVLLAYLKIDAWDMSPAEIGMASRLGIGRLSATLLRLESLSMIEGYWQGGSGAPSPRKRRYVLTSLGQEAARDLEHARIDDLGQSSG